MKPLKINFVGSFTVGYVGESADEVHLARELERLGHKVNKIPRDIWKAYTDGEWDDNWKEYLVDLKADINIIAKWHHFGGKYIKKLKTVSKAPVFYWTWDWMQWPNPPAWHVEMVQAADLHLTGEGDYATQHFISGTVDAQHYYFPFDVADGDLPYGAGGKKEYDVTFFGSYLPQGDRREWMLKIKEQGDLADDFKIKIFSWNWKLWRDDGFDASPPVWGVDFIEEVMKSKICLQFSVNDHLWGYWSNRVGKILTAGGFLLARYTPGMELFLRDGAEYFSSPEEAITKIHYYLKHDEEREGVAKRGRDIGRDRFTSEARVKELEILIDRYLKGAFK